MKITNLARLSSGLGALAALVLLALPGQALQSGGFGGLGAGTADDLGTGDDDIGSLPSLAPEDAPSLLLLGTLTELSDAILDVQGTGQMTLRPVAPGSSRLVLEFEGSFDVTLDSAAFAASNVRAAFGTGTDFAGGVASLYARGAWSSPITLGALGVRELPLVAIGDLKSPVIQAVSPESELYTLEMTGHGDVLMLSQTLR